MEKNIDITVRADRKLAWYRGDSVRYLVLDVAGREKEESGSEKRDHLNLALVIDRSGSMRGAPLQAAQKAAAGVVEMLGKEDLLTVVCFDNEVDTIVKSLAMDDAGRAEAQGAIRRIRSQGMTDLESGWLRGAKHLAENMELSESFRNHIVLLS
ncbi:MAG: VWA domain-containing protein, partial [Thermodesulfobacteriota bacterium]|nr:VWA domain-containing protein [Thermodesulfobacteriota bacterium]